MLDFVTHVCIPGARETEAGGTLEFNDQSF